MFLSRANNPTHYQSAMCLTRMCPTYLVTIFRDGGGDFLHCVRCWFFVYAREVHTRTYTLAFILVTGVGAIPLPGAERVVGTRDRSRLLYKCRI